jgi:hypothetical protein
MLQEEIILSKLNKKQKKWVREIQKKCLCCKNFGVENCKRHSSKLKEFYI